MFGEDKKKHKKLPFHPPQQLVSLITPPIKNIVFSSSCVVHMSNLKEVRGGVSRKTCVNKRSNVKRSPE